MRRRELTLISMIAVLALASFAFAQSPQPAGPPGAPKMGGGEGTPPHEFAMGGPQMCHMGMWHKKLGLSDEQRKQMRSIYTGFLDRTRKARTSLMALKDEQRAMMISGNVDQKKLAQLDEQKVKLVSEVMTERLKMRRDRLAILTPEQIGRLADMIAHKGFRHKMGMGMGMGHRYGGKGLWEGPEH
jgi:Spy/CpxP family protein refolding chaperone